VDNDPLGVGVLGRELSGAGADGQNFILKHTGETPGVLREFIITNVISVDADSKAGIVA
jgi:hypothetical protein